MHFVVFLLMESLPSYSLFVSRVSLVPAFSNSKLRLYSLIRAWKKDNGCEEC